LDGNIFFVAVFFTNEVSSPIWSSVHILEQFQFPWRFIAVASFALRNIRGICTKSYKEKHLYISYCVVILLSSLFYIQVAGYTKKSDSFYLNYPGTGAYHGEATTIWTAGDEGEYPEYTLEIIAGKGKVSNYKRKSNLHKFEVIAENDMVIKDNTNY